MTQRLRHPTCSPLQLGPILLFLILLGSARVQAQRSPAADDSLAYFPYRAGDTWRIVHETNEYAPVVYTVLRDSNSSVGLYLFLNSVLLGSTTGDVLVDPMGDVYSDARTTPHLLYRLRAAVGDRWKPDAGASAYISCSGIYPETVFGQQTVVKEFQRWEDLSEFGGPDSIWRATYRLARGFGLISERYPSAYFYLSGAVIGGVEYGDMVSGVERANTSVLRTLPNPFSERATIFYHLGAREHVQLALVDALGRTVLLAVDEVQEAGERSATIDGGNLPDGAYLYRLRTPSRVLSGTLIHRR